MENCVYRFLDEYENVIYIGKAKNLKNRLNNHKHLPESCYLEQAYIDYACFDNEYEMDFAERYYIQKLTPKYNTKLSDKPISFTSTELDNINFNIYEINQIVVEKSKYQLEQLRLNESNEDDQIHINVDIDLFDFMALSQLFYSNSYRKFFKKSKDEDFSMKSIIKNYEKYKYLKDNVSERISAIRVGLQKKYPLLDISIQFPIISLVPERLIDLENNSFTLYLVVKEKYKTDDILYKMIFKCK